MLKLALIGDLHLDERSPRFEHVLDVLDWTLNDAVSAGADGVVFLGDICEGIPTPKTFAAFAARLKRLHDGGTWTAVVQGNHEHPEFGMMLSCLGVRRVAWDEFQAIHDEASILLVPYPRRGRAPFHDLEHDGTIVGSMRAAAARICEEVVAELLGPRNGAPLIVLGHFSIEGMKTRDAEFEIHNGTEVVVPREAFESVALAAVGHIHTPQDVGPGVIGVGSLIRHSFAEADDTKSYTLVTVDGAVVSWERRAVPAREMIVERLIWQNPTSATVAANILTMRAPNREVRLTVEIPEDRLATFDSSFFDSIRDAAAYFVLDKVTIPVERTRAPEIAQASTLGEQLGAWLSATGQEARPGLMAKLAEMGE